MNFTEGKINFRSINYQFSPPKTQGGAWWNSRNGCSVCGWSSGIGNYDVIVTCISQQCVPRSGYLPARGPQEMATYGCGRTGETGMDAWFASRFARFETGGIVRGQVRLAVTRTSWSVCINSNWIGRRFDWKGVLLPFSLEPEDNTSTDLYLHGDDAQRPGYTLQELFRLAR